jgi:uncharacterized protein
MTILQEVIESLPDGIITDIHLGENWNAVVAHVEGRLSCGLASTPRDVEALPRNELDALIGTFKVKPARELCHLALQKELRQASIGVATMNALLPQMPETWVECNAEQMIAEHGKGKRVAMVGHFPSVPRLRALVGRLDVLEMHPLPGDYPAEAASEVIPQADVVAITGMTLINGTAEGLLKLCPPKALVIMMGPSTLLSPILFEYGIDLLGGSVVEKIDPVLRGVDEGVAEQIFPLGVRMVIMSREKTVNPL